MAQQVCGGAMLKCSFGLAPGTLMVLPASQVMTAMPDANIMDNKPMVNIMPFGMCTSLANPMVAAATAAALGVLTPMPCIPMTAAPHTLEQGDRTIDIRKGKESHTVAGTRSVAVTGAEDHANHGAFTHQVKGDYALTIDGSLTIEVKGAIKLVSKAAVAVEAGTSLAARAGTELSHEAGTNLTSKAGKSLLNQAGLQIDAKAPIINSKADATQTVEAGAMLTLKGAMAKVN